ncbi:MAG: hypothetical protein K6T83_16820 [Alicyclobacillus sp.]|nr:hypothetical protein [Alicyclobacillus sp.]
MPKMQDRQIALEAIRQIRMQLQEQRRNCPLRHRPVLSPQELMTHQVLMDAVRLMRVAKLLSEVLIAGKKQFDPFGPEYEQAERALREAQLAVDITRANWVRLPEKLRKGIEHELNPTSQADKLQVDRSEG